MKLLQLFPIDNSIAIVDPDLYGPIILSKYQCRKRKYQDDRYAENQLEARFIKTLFHDKI